MSSEKPADGENMAAMGAPPPYSPGEAGPPPAGAPYPPPAGAPYPPPAGRRTLHRQALILIITQPPAPIHPNRACRRPGPPTCSKP
ncbi:cleavage and polyadenylation specificity factor subunit 6 [Strongylocentrotus purpuratus]|uniref:Uncharacterized protein n=1 Tax=Strongylocentrotus purpuratus TaxID=7668 RepID=A0A7M7NVT8_STRPU|nr:cleavage and polyadenylation specificity factor subunit 6 [Strongylocentrotus purpuratus]XP_011676972.2 cleavage and polyadenylation specificity factor subunit 6 [Strongylocentrotus purpuratus]XP_030840084.1 cleavage and polyadenylation specificity factor subunit 6 [Strongylocentrotus purpuratus]